MKAIKNEGFLTGCSFSYSNVNVENKQTRISNKISQAKLSQQINCHKSLEHLLRCLLVE
jgi:hypothetical protein